MSKNIIVGVTGSIAAYKSPELVRRIRELGLLVKVVMSQAAHEFITPLTLQAVSGSEVYAQLFDARMEAGMGHIELARWADLIVIAPASANIIAKLALGMSDDLLTTLCLATRAKIVLAPAMNTEMWLHKTVQRNVQQLQNDGIEILPPREGVLACGEVGPGAMMDVAEIIKKLF